MIQDRAAEVMGFDATATAQPVIELSGLRMILRPLSAGDYENWLQAARGYLGSAVDPEGEPDAGPFEERCDAQEFARVLAVAHEFGLFVAGNVAGCVTLNAVGSDMQAGFVSMWVDPAQTYEDLVKDVAVLVCRHAFEDLGLHRVEFAVVPEQQEMRASLEWVGARDEGIAARYALSTANGATIVATRGQPRTGLIFASVS